MALNIVALPQEYIPDFSKGRPLFNAQIYVGEPDLDPEILANRKTVTLRQESGDTVDVPQPIRTSNGGVPTYNGSPAQILVDGNYSIKVLDRFGAQEYYYADYFKGLPIVEGDESRINHNLLADLNAVGGHDAIYRRKTTVAEIATGVFKVGDCLEVTDRKDAPFTIAIGGTANGFDIINAGIGKIAQLDFPVGIVSAQWFGCVLDGVTDDFTVLTRIHSLGLTYSLDGKTAYCSGTLQPKSKQTVYPFGGGISKDTVGPIFRNDGAIDRFIVEDGGLWNGNDISDFIYMGGASGYGNGWTNCVIKGVGTQFATAFTLSNARRIEVRGRWSANKGLVYTNKSAENDFDGVNFIGRGASSRGAHLVAGTDGYPEGLSFRGGMIFGFEENVFCEDILEVNFSGTEFAGGTSFAAGKDAQCIFVKGTSGVCRGIYFENGCHFSDNGIRFGDGTASAAEEYRAIITGSSFRTQKATSDIYVRKFARNITINTNQHETITSQFCVNCEDQNEGIHISDIRPRGPYTRYVSMNGTGEHNSVRDILNVAGIATPYFFAYPVATSGLEGLSNVIVSAQILAAVYTLGNVLFTTTLKLATGTYQLVARSNISAASGSCRFQTPISSADGGVYSSVLGAGYDAQFIEVPDVAQRLCEVQTFTVTKQGTFTISLNQQRGSSTHAGTHNTLGLFRG